MAYLKYLSLVCCWLFAVANNEVICEEKVDTRSTVKAPTAGTGNWTEGIGEWEPPEEMKNFRYYVGGYDFDNRPVVYAELGRVDVKKYVTNADTHGDIYKWVEQFWFRLHNLKSPFEDAEEGIVFVFDMAGFDAAQLASLETMKFHLYSMRLGEKIEQHIEEFIIINLSFVGQTWVNLVKSVAGRLLGKVESFGTDRSSWLSHLSSKIPAEQIPPWYGGFNTSYKPVKTWR